MKSRNVSNRPQTANQRIPPTPHVSLFVVSIGQFFCQPLDMRRIAPAGEKLEVASAEFALGRLLQLQGRDAEAAEHLQLALDILEAILGGDNPETELVRDCLSYARRRENP